MIGTYSLTFNFSDIAYNLLDGVNVNIIAQNAAFDMQMLAGRYGHKINQEKFTKHQFVKIKIIPIIRRFKKRYCN
jgi:hypothetical protein